MTRIPEISEKIKFFDDGKTSPSRRYWATIKEVVPYDEAVQKHKQYYEDWQKEKTECDWLYAKETDYFVLADIPKYDDDVVVFVRTVDGGWFSIDYPHGWMSGLLDIDDKFWNYIKEDDEIFV